MLRAYTGATSDYGPLMVDFNVQLGMSHKRALPVHEPVSSSLLFGEYRTCEIGLSSPICEPSCVKFCKRQVLDQVLSTIYLVILAHFEIAIHLFPHFNNPAQRNRGFFSLFCYASPSSVSNRHVSFSQVGCKRAHTLLEKTLRFYVLLSANRPILVYRIRPLSITRNAV